MEVKLIELVNSFNALKTFCEVKHKGLMSLKLAKLLNKVKDENNTYEQVRIEKVKQYGAINENGDWQVPAENVTAFLNELNPVHDVIVSLDVEKIKYSDLGDIEMAPADLANLNWLIDES